MPEQSITKPTLETFTPTKASKKPDGIILAGIYEITPPNQDPRTVVCTGIEWNADGVTKITFYEPARNQYNDCSPDEVTQMINKGIFRLKKVEYGRRIVNY